MRRRSAVTVVPATDEPPRPAPAPLAKRGRLGEALLGSKLVTRGQLAEVLADRSTDGKPLGARLVELGVLDERDLAETLAAHFALPLVDLRHEKPSPEAVALLPEAVARGTVAVPMTDDGTRVRIAVAEPTDSVLRHLADALTQPRLVELCVAPMSDVQRAVEASYRALSGIEAHVQQFEQVASTWKRAGEELAEVAAGQAPVVQIVNLMIAQALRDRASDIHVEPQDDRLRVRFRIDGSLHDVLRLPRNIAAAITSRIKVMAGMNIVERRRSQDGQLTMAIDGRELDIRVATTATIWGEKTVLRLLDRSRSLLRLGELGMPADTHAEFGRLVRSPYGMVICAGPTGSGKTTTLYATLAEINDDERNVMTIEDPVEYVFPTVNQIQTNDTAGITFADGLRAILRQDPDVILVGEIRDAETARIAVQSALTGHLVLSSLHATDAASALQRFLDMGIEGFLISSSVLGVVGQRLVRKICPSCKAAYTPTADEIAFYRQAGGAAKKRFWHGEGCNLCSGTGYQGRVGVYELLHVSEAVKELVVARAPHDEIRAVALEEGMRPLRTEAVGLVQRNVTTIAEIVRCIYVL